MAHSISDRSIYLILILTSIVLYIPGMMVDVMEIDAAQYASMSMEMLQTGSYLQVFEQGKDYLDKPPLLFWISSISYYLFGLHNWSYKLPSVLFTILAIYAVYRFSKLYYSDITALIASLFTASAQAVILMNNDIRTDNLLLGSVMLAVWQIGEIDQGSRKISNAILAGVGIGLGMLAKGPLGLVIPALSFGPVWIINRNWKMIFQPLWLVSIAIICILLLPMCIGLYHQFDAQPDKLVLGRTGVSGLYFYFWEQSFGRITGASEWKNTTGPFFFVHTFAWAFFPWILYLIPALGSILRSRRLPEWFTVSGFILTFLALSSSRFKLPHYIYVVIPFASIITAHWIEKTTQASYLKYTRWIPAILSLLVIGLVQYFVFPISAIWFSVFLLGPLLFMAWPLTQLENKKTKTIALATYAVVHLNLMFSLWFYPHLLDYQSTSIAMQWADKQQLPKEKIYYFKANEKALHFYNKSLVKPLPLDNMTPSDTAYVYTNQQHVEELKSQFDHVEKLSIFNDFPVTRMNFAFLNHKKRAERLDTAFIIKVHTKRP